MYNNFYQQREGESLEAALFRVHNEHMQQIREREEKQQLKQEIMAECKAYIDAALERAIKIQVDNQASPALKQLKKDFDSIFK